MPLSNQKHGVLEQPMSRRDQTSRYLSRAAGSLRSVSGAFALLLLGTALLLAGLELYYRHKDAKSNPYPIRGLYQLDQFTGYVLKPGLKQERFTVLGEKEFFVSTTSDGLRSEHEIPLLPPKGTFRILVLGSSYAFGWGVSDKAVWTSLLERSLNENPPFEARFEVVNAALPGTHGDVFLKRYIAMGRKYHPDAVILVTQPEAAHGNLPAVEDPSWLTPDPAFETKSPYYIDSEGTLKTYVTQNPRLKELARHSALVKELLLRLRTTGENNTMREFWQTLKDQPDTALTPLFELKRILARDSIPLFVLIRHWAAHFTETPTPQDVMTNKLSGMGIPTANLRPLFEPYENERRYLVNDGHWNEAGHELVAKETYKLIVNNRSILESAVRDQPSATSLSKPKGASAT